MTDTPAPRDRDLFLVNPLQQIRETAKVANAHKPSSEEIEQMRGPRKQFPNAPSNGSDQIKKAYGQEMDRAREGVEALKQHSPIPLTLCTVLDRDCMININTLFKIPRRWMNLFHKKTAKPRRCRAPNQH